jgi:hypothetical protein
MPILDVAHRVVKISGDQWPSYPAPTTVRAQLEPDELFGEADLSGGLSLRPAGEKVQMTADLHHGGICIAPGGRLRRAEVKTTLFDHGLRVDGNVATVHGEVHSESALRDCIGIVLGDLPAFLSAALHAPVGVVKVDGTVGGQQFVVEIKGTFEQVFRVADFATSVTHKMTRLTGLPADGAARLFAAHRYLNEARWLEYRATHAPQFLGARLLSVQKALEVLLSYSSVDELRTMLRRLGVRENVVELLAAVEYVRNQVDVGHPAVRALSERGYYHVHRFALFAVEVMTWLLDHVVEAANDGKFQFAPLDRAGDDKREETLTRIGTVLDTVNPLQPATFVAR